MKKNARYFRNEVIAAFAEIELTLVFKTNYGYRWQDHSGNQQTAEVLVECVEWLHQYQFHLPELLKELLDSDISDGKKLWLEQIYNSLGLPPIRHITERFEQLQQIARSHNMKLEDDGEGTGFILHYGEYSSYGDNMLNSVEQQIRLLISHAMEEIDTPSTLEDCENA